MEARKIDFEHLNNRLGVRLEDDQGEVIEEIITSGALSSCKDNLEKNRVKLAAHHTLAQGCGKTLAEGPSDRFRRGPSNSNRTHGSKSLARGPLKDNHSGVNSSLAFGHDPEMLNQFRTQLSQGPNRKDLCPKLNPLRKQPFSNAQQ